jgi:nitroimidazol reductase NimA-like FMN-containing flavoprotein (pyridoxamine 5'-phosphate oxidase superfamily)
MPKIKPTPRTRIRRVPTRATFDRARLNEILDEALMCHVGFSDGQQTYVIPTLCWRIDNRLFVHGSAGSRMLKILASGIQVCVSVTLLDGIVLARSAFHHSANYRSAVILGPMHKLEDAEQRLSVLTHFMEHIAPGRWPMVRAPNPKELKATHIFWIELDEVSVKIRSGDPGDDEADLDLPVWAGVIPVRQVFGPLQASANNAGNRSKPDYRSAYGKRWRAK